MARETKRGAASALVALAKNTSWLTHGWRERVGFGMDELSLLRRYERGMEELEMSVWPDSGWLEGRQLYCSTKYLWHEGTFDELL